MDHNLKCCVLGCQTRSNQGLCFYRFPCHNPQISSIWEQRISQSANIDILNDHVCELHFDYRCKTGNECALEEGSLPTLHLPNFGAVFSTGNAHLHMSTNRIEDLSNTIRMDSLSYHCRFCFRRGLLYEVEASTYRSKSFMSLIDLPTNVLPDNTQPNACLSCLKSIVIAHKLSMAVEHSNAILQQLLQHPKQSIVVSNTNIFDIKSELACFNLILANSQSVKLEIEIDEKMVWANKDYEQKLVDTGGPTSPISHVNTQNIEENFICIAENQDNVGKMHDSVTSDEQCQNEFHKSFAIKLESTTDLSVKGIPDASENSDAVVLMENTDDSAEIKVSTNSDDSCVDDRQFYNGLELTSKAVNEPTYKCDLCKFITNYKANLAIHKNLHLAGNDTVHFDCQKCEKEFLSRRHFVRHNAIAHSHDFTCKICEKPHASATKLAVHYTEYHHFPCDISSGKLRSERHAHMLDHKQGQTTFTIDKSTHWNDNDGVYVCPTCDWKTPSSLTFNAHMGKHVQSDKNSTIGSQELETLGTDPVRNADGRFQCSECPKAFYTKHNFSTHRRIHTNERPYKCSECPKTFSTMGNCDRHKNTHKTEKPYKCTECPKKFSQKGNLNIHKGIHMNERPYKCTECSKTFSRKYILNIHQRVHANERPYKCTECPKTFNQPSHVNVHKKIHMNERPYKCTECPKTFGQKCTLDIHKRIHTNERPYKCTECPKKFMTKSYFNVHKRIHTNERQYKCTECPKTFNRKSSLHIHERIHRNERPYKCTECPKSYITKSHLSVHERIHMNV